MSTTVDLYEWTATPQFGANVIARASGAPAIPEVDEQIPDLANVAPMIATTSAINPLAQSSFQTEEQFIAADHRTVRQLQYGPLMLITAVCGGIYLLQAVASASSQYSASAGLGAATGYLAALAVVVLIGVAAIYAVGLLFSCDMGTVWSILLRNAAVKTIADVTMLGVAMAAGPIVGALVAMVVTIGLFRWMFKLDALQLTVVVLINGLARIVLFGAALGAMMNGQF